MDWLKQFSGPEITQEDRNKVLRDALEIKTPLLIQIALAIGADPLEGGGKLLVYASEQGDVLLAKKLIPAVVAGSDADKKYLEEATIKATQRGYKEILKDMFPDTLPVAMKAAVDDDLYEMATWLLNQGAVLHIDRECIRKHIDMVKYLLSSNSDVMTNIEKAALFEIISIENSSETLEMLLNAVKREKTEDFDKLLVYLAEECVETDRVDCMKVIIRFGVDIKGISTRYCQAGAMRKFMEDNGAHMWDY